MGSSAISRRGLQASPIAISTRWRIPPENSCGYWCARCAASAIPTISSSSTTRAFVASPWVWPCTSSASPICSPTRMSGLRFDIGSCGTRPIPAPRRETIAFSGRSVSSRPSKRMLPAVITPFSGSRRLTAAAVVDLPDPDSPTIATVSPAATSMLMSLMAVTSSEPVRKATARPLMLSTGSVVLMVFSFLRCRPGRCRPDRCHPGVRGAPCATAPRSARVRGRRGGCSTGPRRCRCPAPIPARSP